MKQECGKMKYLIVILFFPTLGFSQEELTLPAIEGDPVTSGVADGWTIGMNSPDIVTGNGLWSKDYNYYGVEGIQGDTSMGNMAFFCALPSGYEESWKTQAVNLVKGREYTISFKWQQCGYYTTGDPIKMHYQGGGFKISVNGVAQTYSHDSFKDSWHIATYSFVADSSVANIEIGSWIPETGCESPEGCAIVVENVDCIECREAGMN
jgi:hypothetical protein